MLHKLLVTQPRVSLLLLRLLLGGVMFPHGAQKVLLALAAALALMIDGAGAASLDGALAGDGDGIAPARAAAL